MRRVLAMCATILLATSGAAAQPEKLKVYISADMEGIGGVSTWQIQAGSQGREYEKFRKLMTQEVNAAIAGAYDAGATEVLVSDSHADGQNIDVELLDPRAKLIRAWPRPLVMMQGVDSACDAVVFIGYHASEGQPAAILAHTMSSRRIFEIKLNGTGVPEAAFNAAIAGEFGVPVVLLSGDQTIGEEARRLLGPIETVAVKQGHGVLFRDDDAPRRSAAADPRRCEARHRAPRGAQTVQAGAPGEARDHVQGHSKRGVGVLPARSRAAARQRRRFHRARYARGGQVPRSGDGFEHLLGNTWSPLGRV